LPEPGDVTRIARNDDASVTSLSPADTNRVASLDAPGPPVLVPHNDELPEYDPPPANLRSGRFPMAVPAVPPGFRPDRRDIVPPVESPAGPRALTPLDAQSPSGPRAGTSSATPLPEWESVDPPVSQGEPVLSPALPEEDLSPDAKRAPSHGPTETRGVVPPAERASGDRSAETTPTPAPAAGGSRVSFSDQTPREILAREGVTQHSFELAPDPARASQMAVGTAMELRTPEGGALFTVRAKQQVRAQAYTTDVLPGPLPAGLELHSPIYIVRAEPGHAQANTAVVLHAQAESVPDLRLYVFDRDQGWIPLAGHRSEPGSGTFTGIDFGVRAYALLAPAR